MKPLKLTLPDSYRNELDSRLRTIARIKDQDDRENAAAKAVARILYYTPDMGKPKPRTHSANDAKQLSVIREALLGMQTGCARPAVMIANLPHRHGELFSNAMTHIFNAHMRKNIIPIDVSDPSDHNPHMERGFTFEPVKHVAVLYCKNPGKNPMPTIFFSPSEVIHAHVCEMLQLPNNAPLDVARKEAAKRYSEFGDHAYDTLRNRYIDELKSVQVYPAQGQGKHYDFLQPNHNPKWKADGAEEFSLCWPDHIGRHDARGSDRRIPDGAHKRIFDDYMQTVDRLREAVAEGVDTTMVAHSAVFWNDTCILHDRYKGGRENLVNRHVVRTTAHPDYMDHGEDAQFGDRSPAGMATGAPCASIQADTAQRAREALVNSATPKSKTFGFF